MLILSLDTSGETCSVAVAEGASVLAVYDFRHERRLSERLNITIDFILRDTGRSLSQVEALAVGLGPGSFTGVRVGVTMAKVLSQVRGIPVVGVSSLSALVEPFAPVVSRPVVAVVPTRRTESVAAFYAPGAVDPLAAPEVYPNDAIVRIARERFGRQEILLLGEAARVVFETAPDNDLIALPGIASAAAVARLAHRRLSQGDSDDADTLIPLYVTPTPVG